MPFERVLPTIAVVSIFACLAAGAAPPVTFTMCQDSMDIYIGGEVFATYVWRDEAIPRPYFANLHAPGGVQVTRNHPPDPEADAGNDDHAEYHPGLWLAFGDINGADFWRLKARVRHAGFTRLPRDGGGAGSFEVLNVYETDAGATICKERCTYTVSATPQGYTISADSTFTARDTAFAFGDQEEMGFGVRLATPLTVRQGSGAIRNSGGGENEAGTWGKTAAWCAGYGEVGGVRAGAIIMTHPDNFRPSWFHSRDYGLIVANAFGRKAMTGPDDPDVAAERTVVLPGDALRLRYGACFFALDTAEAVELTSMYHTFIGAIE